MTGAHRVMAILQLVSTVIPCRRCLTPQLMGAQLQYCEQELSHQINPLSASFVEDFPRTAGALD